MNFHIGLNRRQTYMLGPGALLVCVFAAAAGVYQAVRSSAAAPQSMAAMLPQGALLTIESPDFGTLLREWNASSEQRAWLASDNYSVFSRSHLFGRLDDARREFEAAAKASPRADTTLNLVRRRQPGVPVHHAHRRGAGSESFADERSRLVVCAPGWWHNLLHAQIERSGSACQ
jgi:hypothetical protein